jgi:hypothetical protein
MSVLQIDLNPRLQRKNPLFSVKKRVCRSCAHLGSNQGPKDYESSTLTD